MSDLPHPIWRRLRSTYDPAARCGADVHVSVGAPAKDVMGACEAVGHHLINSLADTR